ncbi:MAG: shikimate kinase [Pseudomonadota bacterium]|nr:shikimate kinase [Pseudomonadota bacterium]
MEKKKIKKKCCRKFKKKGKFCRKCPVAASRDQTQKIVPGTTSIDRKKDSVQIKSNNILLIGFMGVGKGKLARELARQTDYFAIDTDDLIESLENRTIRNIFKEKGEAYFRNLEQKVADWLAHSVKNTVISTGGGFIGVDNLNDIGRVIYLQSDFNTISEKIMGSPRAKKKIKKRPLFQDRDKAEKLFKSRLP